VSHALRLLPQLLGLPRHVKIVEYEPGRYDTAHKDFPVLDRLGALPAVSGDQSLQLLTLGHIRSQSNGLWLIGGFRPLSAEKQLKRPTPMPKPKLRRAHRVPLRLISGFQKEIYHCACRPITRIPTGVHHYVTAPCFSIPTSLRVRNKS
jgi:hypothetical protein